MVCDGGMSLGGNGRFPLFAHTEEFVGVVVIFWRD